MTIYPMAKVIIKSLFSKPATQLYPVVKKDYYPGTRGRVANDVESCIYCGICQRRCPAGAITVDRKEKSWSIEPMRCIACNFCVEICPKKSLTMENRYTDPIVGQGREG